MSISVVRIGAPKRAREGLRLGTVRLLPRGVRKSQYAARGFFDLWLPEVAPTKELLAYAQARPWTDTRWTTFAKRYRSQMRRPDAQRLIAVLAALSRQAAFSVSCYCENPFRCHRSLLAELLREAGGTVTEHDRYR
jgi:uncharacterized protein YeaO (DUF488 family)